MTIKRPNYTVSVGSPAYWVEFTAYLKAAYLSWGNAEDRNHREEFFNAYIDAAVRQVERIIPRYYEAWREDEKIAAMVCAVSTADPFPYSPLNYIFPSLANLKTQWYAAVTNHEYGKLLIDNTMKALEG